MINILEEIEISIEKLKKFFEDRELLSPYSISRASGLSKNYLDLILKGEKKLSQKVIEKISPILKKYGYE